MLFQSRYRAASHFRVGGINNLPRSVPLVSISLSSGFSFQGKRSMRVSARAGCFNLVIERLLISGGEEDRLSRQFSVSISLSSGFSFQVCAGDRVVGL